MMTLKLDHLAKDMRTKVFNHMLQTRGWKYRAFLRYLRIFKYVTLSPRRGEFLESYYTLMRYIDDVVDGDVPLAENYATESDYITQKIRFSNDLMNPKDEVDYLMMYCFELAKKFGKDFHAETKDILESLLFDAQRRGNRKIFNKEELNHHFHLLDIRGTIKATLKVFNDDPEKFRFLEPLGIACRHQYDLEDFDADIAAGYVNISLEDCDLFGIKPDDLSNSSSPHVRSWLRHHAVEGMTLLAKHRRMLPQGKFTLLEKLVFNYVYEQPARKTFRKIISENKP